MWIEVWVNDINLNTRLALLLSLLLLLLLLWVVPAPSPKRAKGWVYCSVPEAHLKENADGTKCGSDHSLNWPCVTLVGVEEITI